MKITVIALFTCICTLFATETYSQNVKVSLQADNFSLREVIYEIEKQTDYLFVYDKNEVNINRKVSLNAKNESVSEVLKKILDGTGVTYQLVGKNITLIKGEEIAEKYGSQQSSKQITGTVIDQTGESVIGANVVEKGTTNGAITDIDGKFSLSVSENAILQISYIGYTTQEVPVRNQTTLRISLREDSRTLDEVVIVGYGTQKKINLTGAVETVKAERLVNKPVTSLAAALTGEAAGVTITQNSGQPGANQGILRIRGIGTWGDPSPLVLVDGISMSINDVIPSEVESVTVLKDAASAAIYGSRAANGVVLITTKQGEKGKVRINYDGNAGIQRATRVPKMATSWEYAELYNQMMANEGKADENGYTSLFPKDRIDRMRNGGDPDKLEGNTDWYDELLHDAALQQIHQVSLSGGSDKIAYMASLGYSKQEGIIPSTSFERYNARINTSTEITSWFNLGFNLVYLNSKQEDSATGGAVDAFRRVGRSLPYMPPKFSGGTWSFATAPTNPVRMVSGDYGTQKKLNNANMMQVSPEFKIIEGLVAKGTFGYESNIYTTKTFNKTVEYGAFEPAGQSAVTEYSRNKQTDTWQSYRNLTSNALITYEHLFGQHNLKVMGGGSIETFKYAYTTASRQDFPNNDFSEINAGDASTAIAEGNSTYASLASLFGRVNYDYASRYLFEASLRYDGSSKFARGERWGLFPSFSLGWRMSEEEFFATLKNYIQNLKIRGSWGQLGNQSIGDYQFLSTIGSGSSYMFDSKILTGYKESAMGNSVITWETSTNLNVGVDISAIDNKLNFVFDWYKRKTDDILLTLPSPNTLGIASPIQNAGSVENKGWDLTIGWRDQIGKDFNYRVNFNFSDVKNEILDLRGYKSPTTNLTTRIEGEPIDALFGWKTLGICETQEQYDKYSALMKTYNPNWGIGDIIIEDLSPDGKIDADDKKIIGSSVPRFTFGLNLGFDYKEFDFSCFFQGVGKADGYVINEAIRSMGIASARKEHYTDTFNPANPKSGMYFPRILQNAEYNYGYMSHWVQNAAYVRLKNLQLGYTFKLPQVQRLRVYVSGENLFTLTKFRTWDPEVAVGAGGFYPNVTTFSFGVNLSL